MTVPDASFVSRDRARRLGRRLSEALQERRLSWRGGAVGLATLVDRGEELMGLVLDDTEESAKAVVEGRARDRERPYMDVPFAAAAESVAARLRAAREIERGRFRKKLPEEEARRAFEGLLEDAVRRLDAFCAAYDEKRPMGPARPVEVARLLERVEGTAALRRRVRGGEPWAPWESRPPPLPTDPNGLEDLLWAAREALPEARGPWRARRSAGGTLDLALGEERGAKGDLPPALARAAEVLRFLHPVEVSAVAPAAGAEPTGLLLRLADVGAVDVDLLVSAATAGTGRLSPEAEKAVRALVRAPPLPEAGGVPPGRLVAILGVLRVLDAEVARVLGPRVGSGAARVAASRVPREATRKAPPKKDFLAALDRELPGLPVHRVDGLAEDLAAGRFAPKPGATSDAAIALALVGRTWASGGVRSERAFALGDLTDADVTQLVRDLLDLASVRRNLEAGLAVPPVDLTRMERAALSALGLLGRA